ncbi:MAG: type II toxin-antitoxin system HicA family toxin [Planctomycetota bacterium]
MKRKELERHLRAHGCIFDHHGGNHDLWRNPSNNKKSPIPRHAVLKRGTARGICAILGVPKPPGL